MPPSTVPAPPEVFNFAQHLLAANATRHGKAAFIDHALKDTHRLKEVHGAVLNS